ncbi:MAG TPA: KH domain-containing protein [Candidatus Moranbacteria bacterium]|nr:KH domain-containing protein [Candidatus Moranbacteria bacterium]
MDKKIENIIKEVAEIVLQKMGVKADVSVDKVVGNGDDMICSIKTKEETGLLIGQNGENLRALQHLIRLLVRKKSEEFVRFVVDINSYKSERNASVVDLAKEMAKKAVNEKRAVVLRPMSAYERRLVHMTLAENDDVKTESFGEGEERKVVIKSVSHI